jgi:hypothetical protein
MRATGARRPRPTRPDASARNFVLCPNGTYDRSPCGTGSSALLASLAARGELAEGLLPPGEGLAFGAGLGAAAGPAGGFENGWDLAGPGAGGLLAGLGVDLGLGLAEGIGQEGRA